MRFTKIPRTVQANIVMSYFGETVENTFYFTDDTDFTLAEFGLLGETFAQWVGDVWAYGFVSTLLFDHVTLRDLTVADSYIADYPITVTATPATGAGMPGNVSLAIARKSIYAGRSKRGRIYLVGLSEAFVTGNTVDSTFIADHVGFLNGLDEYLADAAVPFLSSIVSRINVGGITPTGTSTLIFRWEAVDGNVDSQRRRLAGRGT